MQILANEISTHIHQKAQSEASSSPTEEKKKEPAGHASTAGSSKASRLTVQTAQELSVPARIRQILRRGRQKTTPSPPIPSSKSICSTGGAVWHQESGRKEARAHGAFVFEEESRERRTREKDFEFSVIISSPPRNAARRVTMMVPKPRCS